MRGFGFRRAYSKVLLLVGAGGSIACVGAAHGCSATFKPCAQGGDLSSLPLVKGDKTCIQRRMDDGRYLNDGRFIQRYRNGKIAIEGDFLEGQKHGVWSFYDENGKKTAERTFRHGVEIAAGVGVQN